MDWWGFSCSVFLMCVTFIITEACYLFFFFLSHWLNLCAICYLSRQSRHSSCDSFTEGAVTQACKTQVWRPLYSFPSLHLGYLSLSFLFLLMGTIVVASAVKRKYGFWLVKTRMLYLIWPIYCSLSFSLTHSLTYTQCVEKVHC